MAEKKKSTRGRKSKWKTHVEPRLEEIKEWAKAGYFEEDIIEQLGISSSTYYDYKNKYSELSDIIVLSRREAVKKLERSGLDIALGYTYDEEKTIVELDENGNPSKRRRETTKKKMPANGTVYMFLLKNWSDGEYSKDPISDKLKEEELKLKKETSKYMNENW